MISFSRLSPSICGGRKNDFCVNLEIIILFEACSIEIKYSKQVGERFLLSQRDVGKIGTLKLKPIYMILFLLKDLR